MILEDKIQSFKDKRIFENKIIAISLWYCGYFLAGLVLGMGTIAGGLHPFGISLVAVSKKHYFIPASIGGILGAMLGGINEFSARYVIAIIIASLGAYAGTAFEINHSPAYPMLIAFLSNLSTGFVQCIKMGSTYQQYILILAEAILCCGGAFFIFRALNASYQRFRFKALPIADITCIVISVSIGLMNLSAIHIGSFQPAIALAILVMLTSLRYGGERWGIILALCFGFTLGIAKNGELFIVGAFSFSMLVSALFSTLSSLGIGISFLCSIGFFAVASGSEIALPLFIEAVLGVLSFLLLPTSICERLEELWDTGTDAPPDGSLRQSLVLKLRFASTAMVAISESVDQVREKINDITRRENNLNRESISEEEYIQREIILEKTNQIRMVASDQFYSIAGMLDDLAFEFDEAEMFNPSASSKIRRLLGDYDIFPINISVIEDKFGRIRVEILTDSSSPMLNNEKLGVEIGKICSRYLEKGKITNFKNETMLSFTERPSYKLSVGYAQHSAEGKLCGDTVKIINDNKGHTILIISDGMGKGSRAALDGAMGAGLLSKLINSGFGFDSALKVINSALLVKSNDESLATLDVANIDLFTGKCEIFKAGAPASFIIKNNSITKCELTSMPAGILRGIEFAKRTAVLSLDDSVLLMSDGITDLGDKWLATALSEASPAPPQEIADYILNKAIEDCDKTKMDDMSIIFATLERN